MPDRFLFENDGKFNNPDIIDLAEKHGISLHGTTAAKVPYSNGI